jgi:hypothetical protein
MLFFCCIITEMQIISEWGQKIKLWAETGIGEWGLIVIVFLVGMSSFGLGRLSALEDARPPVSITQTPSEATLEPLAVGGLIVASRTGSVYYYPWCAGIGKIALGNQIWFPSEAAAQQAGYRPAKNCKGLASQ